MNGFYGDHVLARMIAQENNSHHKNITLSLGWNPIKRLTNALSRFMDELLAHMEQPQLVPVYCTEYYPSC